MIFFHTNPITIFLFLTSLILSSHPYNFSAASDSEVGMFSLSLSYSYLFYFFIFSYDLWAMQTYNCLTSSSRSLIRILLVFISLCFRLEEWFLSIVCIDIQRQENPTFFFLGGSSFFDQITFRKIPLFYNDGTVINTFWQLHVCQITLYSFLFFNFAAS